MNIRYKILEELKASEGFVTGEELGKKLSLSRTAVWKHIEKLKSEGYEITSVRNRGYLFRKGGDIINPAEISSGLKTEFIGRSLDCLLKTDSTNNRAKALAEAGAPDGHTVISEIQTGGKGRRGKSWVSEPGDDITLSIILKPDILPAYAPKITLLMGLAACTLLREFCGAKAFIKWPNDVVIGGKKICGILTEMSTEEDYVKYIICGIGINVGQSSFQGELSRIASSIYIETGHKFQRVALIRELLKYFENYYKSYISSVSFKEFSGLYSSCCINIGKRLRAYYDNKTIEGTGIGINEEGELIIKTDDGKELILNSGEVSVRGVYE